MLGNLKLTGHVSFLLHCFRQPVGYHAIQPSIGHSHHVAVKIRVPGQYPLSAAAKLAVQFGTVVSLAGSYHWACANGLNHLDLMGYRCLLDHIYPLNMRGSFLLR